MINAIVYTSETGFTERYADILGEKLDLPVYSLIDAKQLLEPGEGIIYLGWLMAGRIQGFKEADQLYDVYAVIAVGMGASDEVSSDLFRLNLLPDDFPLFLVQGGLNTARLSFKYKMLMRLMKKSLLKQLKKIKTPTEQDRQLATILMRGGDFVDEEKLYNFFNWYGDNYLPELEKSLLEQSDEEGSDDR